MRNLLFAVALSSLMVACTSTTTPPARTSPLPALEPVAEAGMPAAEPTIAAVKTVENIALGATVEASSTHSEFAGEGAASVLVDGDLGTRWSSDYSEPQHVVLDLGRSVAITAVALHWEAAAAAAYQLKVSDDGNEWKVVYTKPDGPAGPRVDRIELDQCTARHLRLDMSQRTGQWGFSLYEIVVQGR